MKLTSAVRTILTEKLKGQATNLTAISLWGRSQYPIWPCELRQLTTRAQLHQHPLVNWTVVERGIRAYLVDFSLSLSPRWHVLHTASL